MSAKLIKTATLGECMPQVLALQVQAKSKIADQLAGAIGAQTRLTIHPPTAVANLAVAQAIVASLQLNPPSVDLQLTVLANLIAVLQAQLAELLSLRLSEAGISLYIWDGAQGSTATQGITPPGVSPLADSVAVILSGVAPGAKEALKALAGVIS